MEMLESLFLKAQVGYILFGILIFFLTAPITGPVFSLDIWEILLLIAILGWVVYQLIKDVWLNPYPCRNLIKQIIEKKLKNRETFCFAFGCFGVYPFLVLGLITLVSIYFPEFFQNEPDVIKATQILLPAGLNFLCMKVIS